jgi:hypothetical protein
MIETSSSVPNDPYVTVPPTSDMEMIAEINVIIGIRNSTNRY